MKEVTCYLEGCTAPSRDENQLHAAVVESHWTMLKSNIRPYKTGIQETKKVKVAFSIL
jgi:Fe-S cluster assembly scaffold protein SufB